MKTRILMTVLCCIMACSTLFAQKLQLTGADQQNIQQAAVDKVNRFQSSCAAIASKSNSAAQKTNYINTTMQDFQEEAMITVTSFNGKVDKPKKVRRYLERLSLLGKRYANIKITWAKCHITDEFEYDANTGMYIGWAKVTQHFNAQTWERVSVGDVVERTVKIYAKLTEVYDKNRVRKRWVIKLGDISARNI